MNVVKLISGVMIGTALTISSAAGQEFPTKQPVKIVVATNAGGFTDLLARISAEALQKRLGQAVVVENRPGASSTIGTDYVAKSAADGYTILLAGAEYAVIPTTRPNLPYKLEDFTYLIRPFTATPVMTVKADSPFNTTADLVAYMKANPGKARFGSTGVGAINHVGTVMLEAAAGVKGVHISYNGIAPVYTDLLAGTIDFTVGGVPPLPQGLKAIGSSGSNRHPSYPDKPTLEEVGVHDAAWDLWYGFLAPANLPQPVADKLIAEIGAVLKDKEVIAKLQTAAKITPDTEPVTGETFKQDVLKDYSRWKAVVDREKIVVQQ